MNANVNATSVGMAEVTQPAVNSPTPAPASSGPDLDPASQAWLEALHGEGPKKERATAELHDLLLRAARFEISRRRGSLPHLRGDDFDDLAHQCASDALMAILRKLDEFRGESRFTTWAYKFALLEAAVTLRRRSWQGRELPLEPEQWTLLPGSGSSPVHSAEQGELLGEIQKAITRELSEHQREVLLAIAVNGVPIDVMAERLNTTRGALYKTIHDARKRLRAHLERAGFTLAESEGDRG